MADPPCPTGLCPKLNKPREFPKRPPIVCYDKPEAVLIDRTAYDKARHDALLGDIVESLIVHKRSARIWKVLKGDLCRITVIQGSQVGDVNLWNLHNPKERFYSGKTRQLHAAHLTTYDRLWSNLPYLRPMATVIADSLSRYGIDEDGASVHDVIGTRCDNYTIELITGKPTTDSCHSYLTQAAIEAGLTEDDVHDVWNIFMCTGFTKNTGQYFCKASPARKGDYIEFIADMDLLVGLSACPQGDVSLPVGQVVPIQICHPLGVEVFRAKKN
ncbi:uncharacterized protein C11D3.03c isoform X2 [Athalia rosae]|nr:uncharacterized protein C11D3.03c isoform X2 [Athalia rosae]XP_012254271.2 uncharacterized protein C11D3.03c isoform X2 [Athalia rosae]XP_048506169.1 uncharacterized protein C11D3.03c isoform X2 [Athalia rosae]